MSATDKPTERRFFLCTGQCVKYQDLHKYQNSHILGELHYIADEGHQVVAVALWEVTPPAICVPPLNPSVILDIIGDARRIKCRHAGCKRKERWEISKAAFLALMSRYGKESME